MFKKKNASHGTAGERKRESKTDWTLVQLVISMVQSVILFVWILFLLLYVLHSPA